MSDQIDITALMHQCGLTEEEQNKLLDHGAHGNNNYFVGFLSILVKGTKALGNTFTVNSLQLPYVCNRDNYNDFIKPGSGILAHCKIREAAISKSPAGKSGDLEPAGKLGLVSRNTGYHSNNPLSGPSTNFPQGAYDILASSDNSFCRGLADVCESIHTRSYLKCFSTGSFGGLQEAIHYITGAVQNFFAAMYDLYQGIQMLCLQAQMFLNQLIMDIELFLQDNWLYKRMKIFLAIICLVLSTIQVLLDDIGFFATLFKGSDSLFMALNSIQKIVNIGAQVMDYIQHPLTSGLAAAFPKQTQAVFNFIGSIGKIPENYLGFLLKTFTPSKLFHSKGIMIANTIINRYGLRSQLGPLGSFMEQFGSYIPNSNWHRAASPVFGGPLSFWRNKMLNMRRNDPRFSSLAYDENGRPTFTLQGFRNSIGNVFDIQGNPHFNKLRKDTGLFKENVGGLLDTIRNQFSSPTPRGSAIPRAIPVQ